MLLNYYSYASLNLLNHQQLISEVTYTCTICNVLSQYFLDIVFQWKLNSSLLLIRPCLIFLSKKKRLRQRLLSQQKKNYLLLLKVNLNLPHFPYLSIYPLIHQKKRLLDGIRKWSLLILASGSPLIYWLLFAFNFQHQNLFKNLRNS